MEDIGNKTQTDSDAHVSCPQVGLSSSRLHAQDVFSWPFYYLANSLSMFAEFYSITTHQK